MIGAIIGDIVGSPYELCTACTMCTESSRFIFDFIYNRREI